VLEHRVEVRLQGRARVTWPLLWRPMHDALVEDALSCAETALGLPPSPRPWSPYVRVLRRLLDRTAMHGPAGAQGRPHAG
jgi:hypothetical protein